MHDIIDTAVAAGTFKTLATAVTAAGLRPAARHRAGAGAARGPAGGGRGAAGRCAACARLGVFEQPAGVDWGGTGLGVFLGSCAYGEGVDSYLFYIFLSA